MTPPASESSQRALVVAEARKWVGTRYHTGADIPGVAVDCGMLLVRVFVDAGLVAPFDPRPYPLDWHLHQNGEKYLEFLSPRMAAVDAPEPGDVVVFRIGRAYAHGGVVTALDPLTIVHAYATSGRVNEDRLGPEHELTRPIRAPRFYTLWPKERAPGGIAA